MPVIRFAYGAQYWGGDGTAFGDFTNGPGNTAAFNSITYKAQSACAGTPGPSPVGSARIGQSYAAPRLIGRAGFMAANDLGFGTVGGDWTFQVYRAHLADLSDAVQVGETVAASVPGAIVPVQVIDQTTPAAYWFGRLIAPSNAFMVLSQLRFYGPDRYAGAFKAPDSDGKMRWTVPSGAWRVLADIQAPGGGGGGSPAASGTGAGGGGKGGKLRALRGTTPGQVLVIDPGRGGLRGVPLAGVAGNGQTGTPATVDDVLQANSGEGGQSGGNPGGGGGAPKGGNLLAEIGPSGFPAFGLRGGIGAFSAQGGLGVGEVGPPAGNGGAGGGEGFEGGDGGNGLIELSYGDEAEFK
jgi:hypothetical protein